LCLVRRKLRYTLWSPTSESRSQAREDRVQIAHIFLPLLQHEPIQSQVHARKGHRSPGTRPPQSAKTWLSEMVSSSKSLAASSARRGRLSELEMPVLQDARLICETECKISESSLGD